MKTGLLLLVVAYVAFATPAVACSNASIDGSYGFLLTGANSSGLAAVVGKITADGKGNLSGSATISNDGTISPSVTLTGSYKIKSNCLGTAQVTPSGFPTANYNLTIVSDQQFEMVDTDSGVTQSGYALALGTSTCTNAAVKGTFGFQGGGFNSSLVPVAFAGQAKLNGSGKLTGTETVSGGGTVFSGSISGTYTVNADCTGSVTVTFNGQEEHANFVVVNDDNTALEIATDSGKIQTTTATR